MCEKFCRKTVMLQFAESYSGVVELYSDIMFAVTLKTRTVPSFR